MARDPGDTLSTARTIQLTSTAQQFRNSVGGRDLADLYRFSLTSRSQLNLALSNARARTNLRLLDSTGRRIAQGRRQQQQNVLNASLTAGTYYIRVAVNRSGARVTYRLTAAASTGVDSSFGNTNPTLAVQSLTVQRGVASPITGNLLKATDAEQPTGELLYTLTQVPQAGLLLLNGSPLNTGGQFTQADVDSGRLTYQSFTLRTQITNNGTNELGEGLDGTNLIWNVSNSGAGIFNAFLGRTEAIRAFFYNGATGTAVPLRASNTTSELVLGISGSNAIWNGIDTRDSDIEVFFYNGATGTSTQITNNGSDEIAAGISGNNLIWNRFDGSPTSFAFFYNGSTGRTNLITHPNSISDQAIAISGDNVVWSGFDGNDLEVFLYNGTTNTSIQLTNNDIDDIPEDISGSNIIWNSLVSRTISEVFFYNGATGQQTRLTLPDSTNAAAGAISGNYVVWNAVINGSSEVILYDATTNTHRRLTNNPSTDETAYGISGTNVVYASTVNNQSQVVFYNGTTGITTPVTDLNTPALYGGVSGFNLALTLSDGTDSEIFLYNMQNAATADQFGFTVSDRTGGSVAGTFNIAIS